MKLTPILVVTVALCLILSIPAQGYGRFVDDLFNAGHAPLFGVAALVLIQLAPRERKGSSAEYLLVLLLTALLGILTELVQRAEGGVAEVSDAVTDVLGAASFLAVHWTATHRVSALFRGLIWLTVLAVFAAVFRPPLISGLVTLHRNRAFPVILNFDSVWDLRCCRPDDAEFEIVAAPPGSGKAGSERMGRITFEPVKYSLFLITEPYPDWLGYRQFVFTVYSELRGAVQVTLTICDRHYSKQESDSYRTSITINPGMNTIRIPLAAVEQAPATRRMDMAAIRRIILTAVQPQNRFSVYVDDFRLE